MKYKAVPKYRAVLSTVLLPDGIYEISTLPKGSKVDLSGVPHYCGHSATAALIESLGAVKAKKPELFPGLDVYERALCVPNVTLAEIEFREILRIE